MFRIEPSGRIHCTGAQHLVLRSVAKYLEISLEEFLAVIRNLYIESMRRKAK